MRFRTNHTHIKNPEHSKRIPWTKYVYLTILGIIVVSLFVWGKDSIFYIQAPAVIEGHARKLSPSVNSRIYKIDTQIGKSIEKGNTLVYMRRGDLEENALINLDFKKYSVEQQINDANGRLNELNRQEELQKRKISILSKELENARKLYEINAIPYSRYIGLKLDYEDVEAGIENIKTKIMSTRETISTLQNQLSNINVLLRARKGTKNGPEFENSEIYSFTDDSISSVTLVSPVDGKVTDILKEEGETVLPGETVVEVVDISEIYLRSFFDQDTEKYLKKGKEVSITFQTGQKSKGTIREIYPVTSTLLTEYEKYIKSRDESLIVEIIPSENSDKWPSILGVEAKVKFSRF